MVDDSLDGPLGGAIWALQHVTVNVPAQGWPTLGPLASLQLSNPVIPRPRRKKNEAPPCPLCSQVNADGLGLCPKEVKSRMTAAGFNESRAESHEMIGGLTKLVVGYKD